MPVGELRSMMLALHELEKDVSDAAKAVNPKYAARCYAFRPLAYPELPAIWNWIDDGSVEVPDTARVDDSIVVTTTIAVAPTNPVEDIDRLVGITDVFRSVVDPALKSRPVLPDENGDATARAARRLFTRTAWDQFDDKPVLCMEMLIRVDLARIVG